MNLSPSQQHFVEVFEKFIHPKSSKIRAMKLTGGPGTGKSYAITYVLKNIATSKQILLCAPTNQATLNLALIGQEFDDNVSIMTIHKSLSLGLNEESPLLEITQRDNSKPPMYDVDIAFVDEASMVDNGLLEKIVDALQINRRLKIVVVGDKDQLFPLNMTVSPLLESVNDTEWSCQLEGNNRFSIQSDIFATVDNLRGLVNNEKISSLLVPGRYNRQDEHGSVFVVPPMKAKSLMMNVFTSDKGTSKVKVLAWRRNTFRQYNSTIQKWVDDKNNITRKFKFQAGDRIKSYTTKGELYNGDEGIVTKIRVHNSHPDWDKTFPNVNAKVLELYIDINRPIKNMEINKVYVPLTAADANIIEDYANRLMEQYKAESNIKKKKGLISNYWKFKGGVVDIELAFSQTVHSSQGSTYEIVFVDVDDIMLCHETETRHRMLYVAASRARKMLVLITNKA